MDKDAADVPRRKPERATGEEPSAGMPLDAEPHLEGRVHQEEREGLGEHLDLVLGGRTLKNRKYLERTKT